ncbi:MAG: ABC transporter permease [Candidatus Humimicrobiaceae bacterium]
MVESKITDTLVISKRKWVTRFIRKNIVFVTLVVVIAFFSFISPSFLTLQNMLNVGRQATYITIIAAGMTLVIISANIDLSVGSTLAMASMVTALTIQATNQVALGFLAGIATGALIGLINGALITKGRIPSFLVTLGIMGAVRGIANMITSTLAVQIYKPTYWNLFGEGKIGGIFPVSIIWTIAVLIVIHILLRYTTLGRYIYATGGNIQAAKFTGVKTDRVVIWAFVITGILSALAGIILSARMHAARPNIGSGLELDAIAAVILGGTSLYGGKGTIVGTLIGSLVIGTLNNGLILVGFDTYVQTMVRGIVIIAAVVFAGREGEN